MESPIGLRMVVRQRRNRTCDPRSFSPYLALTRVGFRYGYSVRATMMTRGRRDTCSQVPYFVLNSVSHPTRPSPPPAPPWPGAIGMEWWWCSICLAVVLVGRYCRERTWTASAPAGSAAPVQPLQQCSLGC